MDWHELLDDALKNSAFQAVDEMAWPKDQAISVIDTLHKNRYFITGVDIWVGGKEGPIIPSRFVYDWDLEAQSQGASFVSARQFVAKFEWDRLEDPFIKESEPLFNIWAERRE